MPPPPLPLTEPRRTLRTVLALWPALLLAACSDVPTLGGPSEAPLFDDQLLVLAPGNTVVGDGANDLQLRGCSAAFPGRPCSLPPGVPLASPAWTDIHRARMTQIGQ